VAPKARSRTPATRAAVPLPRRRRRSRPSVRFLLGRLAPSRRSLAVGLGLVAVAGGAYAVARETSAFAIRTFDVRGGSPAVDAQVRDALSPLEGRSLVGLDGAGLVRRVEALPTVVRASYDRAFPHTIRVMVVPERPAAVLRSGSAAWLVSARARVIGRLGPQADRGLPRIWRPASASVRPGEVLEPAQGGVAARAVGHAGSFAHRVRSAAYAHGFLVFELRSGLELRLGDTSHLQLKLAVAARALPVLPAGTTYLDVGVPGRPVSGTVTAQAATTQQSSSGG
jgi:cell division protein FtsQ